MSISRSRRIEANCKKIWGSDDAYDIDVEGDEFPPAYNGCVRKDFGTSFGIPLTMTGTCRSAEAAYAELDRMLGLWAKQVESGKAMTKEEKLEIFSGPRGEHRRLISRFIDLMEKKESKEEKEKEGSAKGKEKEAGGSGSSGSRS
ncbi:uncharacterized protein F4822DRAFT_420849 [Hypoxylon trugodes]|uniref:uncharacterized protein n=1 Tax=Hypoxylon trugodes TaxID=326681 RepID=UPI00219C9F50|nr:uncharacterized protein F4822DRAFT_420849 [Hypoxylon trugodes]KAI1383505.1 hypothetical protein F4822DRAFT_420849 [Hypoxylon trugodes]